MSLRYLTAIAGGLPASVPLTVEDLKRQLPRCQCSCAWETASRVVVGTLEEAADNLGRYRGYVARL